tara:strand:- start:1527 stop:1739 length:213 start_codon:yes stop_codon:yes gene_type:complete
MGTVTAPIRLISEIHVTREGAASQVVGTFAPRIDYPGGIEAFAGGLWESVHSLTSPDETRFVVKLSRMTL